MIAWLSKALLVTVINYHLMHATSFVFRCRLDNKKVEESFCELRSCGLKEKDPQRGVYVLKSQDFIESLLEKGARLDGRILSFDTSNTSLKTLLDKMHVPYDLQNDRYIIPYSPPKSKSLIYCPGSGHIFEFRKQTISYLCLSLGLDVIVFRYPGVMGSQGQVNQRSLEERIDTVVQIELKSKDEHDVVLYGHCEGAALMMSTALKHPQLKIIVDRTFTSLDSYLENKLNQYGLKQYPKLTKKIKNWVRAVYHLDTNYALKRVNHENVFVLYSSFDEFLDPSCRLIESSNVSVYDYDLKLLHNQNLIFDEVLRSKIEIFLSANS